MRDVLMMDPIKTPADARRYLEAWEAWRSHAAATEPAHAARVNERVTTGASRAGDVATRILGAVGRGPAPELYEEPASARAAREASARQEAEEAQAVADRILGAAALQSANADDDSPDAAAARILAAGGLTR